MMRCLSGFHRPQVRIVVCIYALMSIVGTGCQRPGSPVDAAPGSEASEEESAHAPPATPDKTSQPEIVSEVIVVGAGISGLATALELGRGGAKVVVIDMSSVFGGHAVMSQGSLSIAGSPVQEAAGGELVKMDHQWNYFTGIPDPRYPGTNRGLSAANMYGIIVNAEGKRFANLHGWAKAVMPPLLQQEQATLWFIFDEATKPYFVVSGSDWADFKKVDQLILQNPALVQRADSWEELAEKSGLPPQNLVKTVERYNELVARGVDEDFQRFGPGRPAFSNEASPALKTPPYYAMQAWPLTRKSMGGVAIDRECRVVDRRKQPIPGLFAVGELTGLALINGKAAVEGTFLGPCIVTGRKAARSILSELKRSPVEGGAESGRCARCHDIAADLADPRPGYWHFEHVHRVVLERGTDCRQCHAELTPYREKQHHIRAESLAASCFQCHTARE